MEPTQNEILSLIKKGESETIEFKRQFDRETTETLVAFANIRGGKVLVGIADSGRIEELTVKKLLTGDYVSMIRNRLIADMFRECGLIEKYGTGIRRILKSFRDYNLPDPKFEEIAGGFRVTVYRKRTGIITGEVTGEVIRMLPLCFEPISRKELMEKLGLRHEDHFRKAYLVPALEAGLIERTVPDKPRSRLQRYRLTAKGKASLKNDNK